MNDAIDTLDVLRRTETELQQAAHDASVCLDAVRAQRTEAELEQAAHEASIRLGVVRDLIALCNQKPRGRRGRAPATDTGPSGPGPVHISIGLEGALNRLGDAVHAQTVAALKDAA